MALAKVEEEIAKFENHEEEDPVSVVAKKGKKGKKKCQKGKKGKKCRKKLRDSTSTTTTTTTLPPYTPPNTTEPGFNAILQHLFLAQEPPRPGSTTDTLTSNTNPLDLNPLPKD